MKASKNTAKLAPASKPKPKLLKKVERQVVVSKSGSSTQGTSVDKTSAYEVFGHPDSPYATTIKNSH
jgi:hypothetical protein